MFRWRACLLAAGLCLGTSRANPARAPRVLRLAAIAPDGSAWARLLRRFADEVATGTHGGVRIKWYFGGVAGDEITALDRSLRGQLDGLSGAIPCQRVAPTLRVLEVIGLVQSDDEAAAVLTWLRPDIERDFRNTPFTLLTLGSGFGHRVLFSRVPVRSMEDLQRGRFWVYAYDEVERAQLAEMGIRLVPLDPSEVARAFDEGRIDGALSVPQAAMEFGYATKARYYTDLKTAFLPGCLMVDTRALEDLGDEDREALQRAGAALGRRFARMGRDQDHQLIDEVFPRHGLVPVPMSPRFREQLLGAARAAGDRLGPRLVPAALVRRVAAFLWGHAPPPEH